MTAISGDCKAGEGKALTQDECLGGFSGAGMFP